MEAGFSTASRSSRGPAFAGSVLEIAGAGGIWSSFVTGLNSDPPLQVKVTYDGFYLQSVKGYIYH
uniref:Uncharacterized protein n=1 Tax=Oryza rufipogon TaxID=4529 RepID=A0A0E0P969_ORYRU